MTKRRRNKHLSLMLTEEEFEYFKKKKIESGVDNYTDFIMKAVTYLQIVNVDTSPIIELSWEVNKIGVNINQMAKVANMTGSVSYNDINRLREQIDNIEKLINDSLEVVAATKEGKIYGIYKNKAY